MILHLRDPTYADSKKIRDLAVHYSEYVNFPIYVRVEEEVGD